MPFGRPGMPGVMPGYGMMPMVAAPMGAASDMSAPYGVYSAYLMTGQPGTGSMAAYGSGPQYGSGAMGWQE